MRTVQENDESAGQGPGGGPVLVQRQLARSHRELLTCRVTLGIRVLIEEAHTAPFQAVSEFDFEMVW